MEMTDLIEKAKANIVNIALIVVALIVANNIHSMQSRSRAELNEKIRVETERNKVLSDINGGEKNLERIKRLVNKKDMGIIMSNLQSLAKDSSVIVTSLKPQSERDQTDYIKYPYDLTVEGSYHAISRFISKAESSPVVYVIESIIMHPMDSRNRKDASGKLTADLKVSTIQIKE